MSLHGLSERLQTDGWASLKLGLDGIPCLKERVTEIARSLGSVVVGPGGTLVETISPRSETTARAASLSHRFGCGALPLHCDTAHWIIPCRYIVLACMAVGSVRTPTLLVNAHDPNFSGEERLLARSKCFLVRNGRKSFYASIVDSKRSFVRIDPGCMEPVTEASATAMRLYDFERQRSRIISFDWKAGDVLIIDNWRMLHGRGNETAADSERQLVRAYVQ
jgi:Taurine catabolism dioxygenase TauD, TfdA family